MGPISDLSDCHVSPLYTSDFFLSNLSGVKKNLMPVDRGILSREGYRRATISHHVSAAGEDLDRPANFTAHWVVPHEGGERGGDYLPTRHPPKGNKRDDPGPHPGPVTTALPAGFTAA